jgi:thioredoxin reductase (NADPH)
MGLSGYDRGRDPTKSHVYDAVVVGGGLAGLSAAIYLGRSQRDTLLVHSGHSMAKWEEDVQNYLGFPEGISGSDLLARGLAQVQRFEVEIATDNIRDLKRQGDGLLQLEGLTRR